MESEIDAAERVSRSLAALISDAGEISQERYANFASEIADDLPGVINIAWAPGLIITHVYPIEGNEAVIGLDYRTLPDQIDDVQLVRDSGTIAVVGPLELVQGPLGIILRLPVFVPSDEGARVSGVLSMVYDLDKFIAARELEGQALGLDVALTTDAGAFSSDEAVVVGDPAILADDPVNLPLILPEREWTLHARPIEGWVTVQATNRILRYSFLVLAVLAMLVSVSAFWLASSRKRTIDRMRLTDERLDGVIRNAPGVFYTYKEINERERKLDFISNACRDVWGFEPEDFYRDATLISQLASEDQRALLQEEIEKARKTMSRWTFVWKSSTSSGQEKWLQGWGQPSRVDNDRIRWDNFVVDVTESREKDIQLESQAAIVLQSQKQESIGQLTGGVAHDFNNLLAVILGNLELLRDEISKQEQLDLIDASLNAIKRGASLTGNMLAFARKARLEPRVIDLNELVTES